jgi:chromosome partitioning protein
MSEMISIVSQKGGVGKTTSAVCIGWFLARAGYRTLLLDLDLQNGLAIGVGLLKSERASGTYDMLTHRTSLDQAITRTRFERLDAIPFGESAASPTLIEATLGLGTAKRTFAEALDKLRQRYDFILADTPSGSATSTKFALFRADSVLLPLQCQPLALRILPGLLRAIRSIKRTINPGLRIRGLLLTMFDLWDDTSERIASQVWAHFPERLVFRATIPKSDIFQKIFSNEGNPLLEDEPPEALRAYELIAREIAGAGAEIAGPSAEIAGPGAEIAGPGADNPIGP